MVAAERWRFARAGLAKYGSRALRNIVFRFDGSCALGEVLEGCDHELPLPQGESVADGEWVLAVFQLDEHGRSTASAARGVHRESDAVLTFEPRDWQRLCTFVEADSLRDVESTPTARHGSQGDAEAVARAAREIARDFDGGSPAPPEPGRNLEAADEAPSSVRSGQAPSFDHWRASDPFTQGPNARVLVVDDDRDIRDVVGAMLDAVGLAVDSVPSAEEALERMRAQAFDLVVLDWNLPGITGIELCRLLRRDPSLTTMPVLFLTAHASSRDVVEAFASGADDYVVKPFRAPELGARIFGLLRRARMSQVSS
jgi:two-component system phosphate regulon response regulator PhoB